MIDLLFTTWNRYAFTVQALAALARNTNWDLVRRVYLHDDGSSDGTQRLLEREVFQKAVPAHVEFVVSLDGKGEGPVAAMNWYLDQEGGANLFAKVDNDIIVPPGWLDSLVGVMARHPELMLLGAEPRFGPPAFGAVHVRHGYVNALHIGGVGLMRREAFDVERPIPAQGRLGFTSYQERHAIKAGFVAPDLRLFWLDRYPFEPFASLSDAYTQEGWQRDWGRYPVDEPGVLDGGREVDMSAYWNWWEPVGRLESNTGACWICGEPFECEHGQPQDWRQA